MSAPQADPVRHAPFRSRISTFAGLLLVALATAIFAGLTGFKPRPGFVGDFTQDWLSARDYATGRPVYGDLPDALRRHFGAEPPEDFLRWNAHPPGSVLLVLPLAGWEHDWAFCVWNLVTFPLFVFAVWIAAVEWGVRAGWRAAAVAAGVSVLGVTGYPLLQQFVLGQFNALLAFLVTLAWAADRRGCGYLAGTAVGTAAAIKLFPSFLLVYFLATRRWRAAAAAGVACLVVNGFAIGLFGVGAYRTYVREVVPSVSTDYASRWNNLSCPAFWRRVFDPADTSGVRPVVRSPEAARVSALAAQLVVVALVFRSGRRAGALSGRDRAYAAAVTGMLLVSPITWPHYLVMLVVPVAFLIAEFPTGARRWGLVVCLAVLWLPDTFFPALAFGRDEAGQMSVHRHRPLSSAANLLVASVPHYALVGLFLLTLRAPVTNRGL